MVVALTWDLEFFGLVIIMFWCIDFIWCKSLLSGLGWSLVKKKKKAQQQILQDLRGTLTDTSFSRVYISLQVVPFVY